MRFHLGAFLVRMRLHFFSCLLFVSAKFSCIGTFFALNVTKSPYTFVNRNSVISWSPKEGN